MNKRKILNIFLVFIALLLVISIVLKVLQLF